MRDGFLRLRLNEGAIKARVKSDTSANNWPMNAQFFFSSYVTCHATSWTRTPSGGGSRGTKDKLQRLRQITLCLSPCTDPATIASCRNMLRRHLAATNRFECTGEILWKSLSLQQNFVAATSHTKYCLIWFFATCCCDKILLEKIQKFSSTHEPICHCDVSCCSNLSPSVYRP